jgi:UDP-N-acetylglucosamine 2-epimerase
MPSDLRKFCKLFPSQRLILVTAHRRENWGQPIRNIAKALGEILREHPDTVAVWPVHPNPAVRVDVEAEIGSLDSLVQQRICLTRPLGYQVLIALLARCKFSLTDSGGIQEEASAFSKPVLVARASTERQELIEAGGAFLVGTDVAGISGRARLLLNNEAVYRSMQLSHSPFGDGRSSMRIAEILIGGTRNDTPTISQGLHREDGSPVLPDRHFAELGRES